MKILICGVGSVGERHISNLLSLGYEDIILFRTSNKQLRNVKVDFKTFLNLQEALNEKPDIAFVTNPTSLHIETAITCANAGCHIFIEKPLSMNMKKVKNLKEIVDKKSLICMTGFMYRYHPLIKIMKAIVDDKKYGNLVFVKTSWGEYLPDWHPWEDYKSSYAAIDNLGGGPTSTLSHDLDLCIWLVNSKVIKSTNFGNYNSSLDIKSSHSNDILLKFKNGVTANLHFDFVQKPYQRKFELVFDKGKVIFDYYSNKLILYNHEGKIEEIVDDSFERNDMFIAELEDLFDAINNNKTSPISIVESIKSLKIISKNEH